MNTSTKYSAINTTANQPDPYSILNPDTSSDSASLKSKGVRFPSANEAKIHPSVNGAHKRATGVEAAITLGAVKEKEDSNQNTLKRRKEADTSYDTDWATPRRTPSVGQGELEENPVKSKGNSPNVKTTKNNKGKNKIEKPPSLTGIRIIVKKDHIKNTKGIIR